VYITRARLAKSGNMATMNKPTNSLMERFLKALHWAVLGIEVLVAMALTALAAGALASLAWEMWHMAAARQPLTHEQFIAVVGGVLQVFILVELFGIAIAYMKHENVIPTVLEAGLVAVARQFVVFEGSGTNYLPQAAGLSMLLLAVAVAWWLLAKSNACEMNLES
jgi:uncharacterized membrane protein (DUF373 family)